MCHRNEKIIKLKHGTDTFWNINAVIIPKDKSIKTNFVELLRFVEENLFYELLKDFLYYYGE